MIKEWVIKEVRRMVHLGGTGLRAAQGSEEDP